LQEPDRPAILHQSAMGDNRPPILSGTAPDRV